MVTNQSTHTDTHKQKHTGRGHVFQPPAVPAATCQNTPSRVPLGDPKHTHIPLVSCSSDSRVMRVGTRDKKGEERGERRGEGKGEGSGERREERGEVR